MAFTDYCLWPRLRRSRDGGIFFLLSISVGNPLISFLEIFYHIGTVSKQPHSDEKSRCSKINEEHASGSCRTWVWSQASLVWKSSVFEATPNPPTTFHYLDALTPLLHMGLRRSVGAASCLLPLRCSPQILLPNFYISIPERNSPEYIFPGYLHF